MMLGKKNTINGEFLRNNYENNTHRIHIIFILSSGFKFLTKNAEKISNAVKRKHSKKLIIGRKQEINRSY